MMDKYTTGLWYMVTKIATKELGGNWLQDESVRDFIKGQKTMKTKSEIQAQIDELQKQLEDGWPQENEDVSFLSATGNIFNLTYSSARKSDEQYLNQGNAFRTEGEAIKERDRRAVTKKLRDIAGGWVPDWSSITQLKFYVFRDHYSDDWHWDSSNWQQTPGVIYFKEQDPRVLALGSELDCLL